MYSHGLYEVVRIVYGPYDGKCTVVEPESKKNPVMKVNSNVLKEPDPKNNTQTNNRVVSEH